MARFPLSPRTRPADPRAVRILVVDDERLSRSMLEDALHSEQGNPRGWLALGMAYQFTGKNDRAITAYEKYLEQRAAGFILRPRARYVGV